jgi:Tfp pilus assembly protein PilX
MIHNSQKGISVYIAFMIMAILSVIGFGLSTILLSQIEMMRGMGNSVVAFYAAETGVERTLYEISQGAEIGERFEDFLENDSSYIADIIAPDGDCSAQYYCIKSVGLYQETKRAIQATR